MNPARIKITKRSVDAIKATGARHVIWDTDLAGFGIRVGATGSKTYVLKYRIGGGRSGRVRWGVIGTHGAVTPDQARDIAKRWAAEVAAGGDPAGQKIEARKSPIVAELMNQYLEQHVQVRNKPSTASYANDIVQRLVLPDPIARVKVEAVTTADIARLHSRLSKTPTTANRVLSALSKAFSLAELWGYRPKHSNPCHEVEKFPEVARERFLSDREFADLGDALAKADTGELLIVHEGKSRLVRINKYALAAIRLLIFTGARRGEILGLRWEWIDWREGRANLPDSKTGRKPLMLPPPALDVLRSLESEGVSHGFVIRGGNFSDPEVQLQNLKDPWRHISQAAGLSGVRIHDLRHSFASVMIAGGASLPMIGALLGHRDVKTTQRYAHLSTDPMRSASDHAGSAIDARLKGNTPGADIVHIRGKPPSK